MNKNFHFITRLC